MFNENVSLEKCPALVLNADYRPLSYYPLSLWSWQDSIKSVFLNRVSIVSYYERVVRSPSFSMKLPSVIALKDYIKPTKFLKIWDLLGVGLGFGSTILGKKAAMLCTASVEEVIDKHYQNQIDQIGDDEVELKKKIIKFREDELHHKNIAFEEGASKEGFYKVLDGIIKTGSKIAIKISEKY